MFDIDVDTIQKLRQANLYNEVASIKQEVGAVNGLAARLSSLELAVSQLRQDHEKLCFMFASYVQQQKSAK